MVFEIVESINHNIIFREIKGGDAWKLNDLLVDAGLEKNNYVGCAGGYENCIVFIPN